MIHGCKIEHDGTLIFLLRKHSCPNCQSTLERKKHEKVVHSESPEAKDYDFSMPGGPYMYGNIKFITFYYWCPNCKNIYGMRELINAKKAARRAAREAKGKTGFYKLSDYILSVLESIRNGFSKTKDSMRLKRKKPMKKDCTFMKKGRIYSIITVIVVSVFLIAFIGRAITQEKVLAIKSESSMKYSWNASLFYVYFKRHHCPLCGTKLKTSYYSVIVNSDSPEAKKYDFSVGDSYVTGDLEFRTMCFKCPKCEIKISFDEMKRLEKQQKLSP